jgi:hypothetical protein
MKFGGLMMQKGNRTVLMRTNRNKAHYADKCYVGNQPVVVIKVGKKTDYLTAVEFLEELYEEI